MYGEVENIKFATRAHFNVLQSFKTENGIKIAFISGVKRAPSSGVSVLPCVSQDLRRLTLWRNTWGSSGTHLIANQNQ